MLILPDADFLKTSQIKLDHVFRRRLKNNLILVIMLHAVGVFAVAAVFGSAARVYISHMVGFGTQNPEKRGGIEGSGALFKIVGLLNDATLTAPVLVQGHHEFLKRKHHSNCLLYTSPSPRD